MSQRRYPVSLFVIIAATALIVGAGMWTFKRSPEPHISKKTDNSITILWAKWKPADYLQSLAEEFTERTGIKVKIDQESWSNWQTIFFDEMAKKGKKYDMVIGDSQWLGRGVKEGHYIELTKWMQKHEIDSSMISASISGYAEFPKKSGHYWAIPVEGDAMGFSYRKDLFEDTQEQDAFKKRYGYPLHIPKTWFELRDIAEFFYRPEQDLYGVLCWMEPQYDGITMGVQSLLWSWGASLGDQETYRVKGILDSAEGIKALEFYKELNAFNNNQWIYKYLDKNSSSNEPMMLGRVAMAMVYFAISGELLDSKINPYSDNIGFFAVPSGPLDRVTSLGGQGISIVSYSKKKELSLQFLEWFVQDEVQQRWAELGGLSCNTKVLNSEKFLNASPINKPFKESIEMVRDFWAVPEYPELLAISQKYFSDYLSNDAISAEETMSIIARKWEAVFEYAGYYKE